MGETVGVVGYGHLGSALTQGLQKAGYDVVVNNGSLERTHEKLRVDNQSLELAATLEDLSRRCSLILVCVGTEDMDGVLAELDRHLRQEHIVVSFAAQRTRDDVHLGLGRSDAEVVKGMTTLAVESLEGVSAFLFDEFASYAVVDMLTRIMDSVGLVTELGSEEEMQVFTALVGCFPGALAEFVDAWQQSGNKRGLNLDGGTLIQLIRSGADLLEKYDGNAQTLLQAVASKGGVTEAMVASLDKDGFRDTLDDGVGAGIDRMKKGLSGDSHA